MCAPTAPVNGTWTPTQRLTPEQQAELRRQNVEAAEQRKAETGTLHTGSSSDRSPFSNIPVSVGGRETTRQTLVHNARADADQRQLAAWDRQGAKTAQAPAKAANAAGGGGPSTLLTGGTAADALSAKKPRTAASSLLGGG
jgi:hypothetical protein